MDNVISGEMTAALIEGVSDISDGIRHGAGANRAPDGQGSGDLLSENGMIVLCRCGSAIVNVNYHPWSLPCGGVITIFPGDVVSVGSKSHDFTVDMENSVRLRKMAPENTVFVSESGIKTSKDIRILYQNRVDAVLIGETLMRSPDKKAALEELNKETA